MKSLMQVTLQVRELLGFELRENLPSSSLHKRNWPRQGQASETISHPRSSGPLAPAPLSLCPILEFCLFPTSPTKCPQAAKEPTHS